MARASHLRIWEAEAEGFVFQATMNYVVRLHASRRRAGMCQQAVA